jgi:hypothetical protein
MNNNGSPRYMVQEMGILAVILLMVTNAWLLVSNMNYRNSEIERLKKIESTRFTAADGAELRAKVELNREELKKVRDDLLVNRKIGQEIIDSLKSSK